MPDSRQDRALEERKLFRLRDLSGYEVAENEPDIRGWELVGSDGTGFGEVEELVVEKDMEKVRYVDVRLHEDFVGEAGRRHILLPIGLVALRENERRIFVDRLNRNTIRDWPAYEGGLVERAYEDAIRQRLFAEEGDWRPASTRGYYDYGYYDYPEYYGRRRTRT